MTDQQHAQQQQHENGHKHGHQHGHDATHMDWDVMGPLLELGAEVESPVVDQAAVWLRERREAAGRPEVRRLLDVGSGPGVGACQFAQAFPDAEVVAVDGTRALLERARARAEGLGLAGRVRTCLADIPDGLGTVGDADLIWSGMALHHIGDQRSAVDRLGRLLRPGGLLAVAEGGLPTRSLPRDIGFGRPGLQARLEVLNDNWFNEMRAALPDSKETVEDWPAFLTAAGLTDVRSRTFLIDLPAPLGADARAYLHATLTRRSESLGELLDAEDRAALARLLDPEDPQGLMLRPDVFLLSARTVHTGVKPA
ncbi:methyltransferase domain-containing protein [Streptomyces sp. NPDC050610]|uniref:class I SAM-dependent methyltransferase n=1 Tax=Streptomyces sp. NPDC050610 TaxID=3157097 RepID=UPI003415BF16